MKFSRSPYEITKSDDEDFDNKLAAFIQQTKTSKSLMLTLVTSFGIVQNKYYRTYSESGYYERFV